MGRSPCCDKVGLKKGPWTPEEDQKLLAYIEEHGHGNWRALPTKAGLQRCGKSCRLRWTNYLRPDIKRGKFSLQEEQTIIQLHALLGNRWSAIATHLPKRTDNEIKNYWNTHLKKRLAKMGIDPVTHKPKNDALLSNGSGGGSEGGCDVAQSKSAANLSHMAQWESARLEAEARLARQSKSSLQQQQLRHNSSSTNSFFQSHHHLHQFGGGGLSSSLAVPSSSSLLLDFPQQQHYPSSTTNSSSSSLNVISGHHSVSPSPPLPPSSSCLDVLRACQFGQGSNWVNNKDSCVNNGGRSNNAAAGVGVTHHSPTSTLSFSENGAVGGGLVIGGGESSTAAAGTVIEFMGNNNSNSNNYSTATNSSSQGKPEGSEWKLTGGGVGFGDDTNSNNNNEDDDDDDEDDDNDDYNDGLENSMSFTSDVQNQQHHLSMDKNEDDDNNQNITTTEHQSINFMDGFTELLLSNFPERTTTPLLNEEADNASGGGGRTGSGGEVDHELYEDNKSYWNSILNLVNSSPSSSPLF